MEKRVQKLEEVVGEIGGKIASIASDFKYMRERINGYLETHDKVIRIEEQIKVANNRLNNVEDSIKDQSKEITAIKVKYASIAAIVSIVVSFLSTLLLNSL